MTSVDKIFNNEQVKSPQVAKDRKNQSKAYDMIRQAIGINKDGPSYQTFSNVFSLGGQGNTGLGIQA